MSSAVLEKLLRCRLFHARQYIMKHNTTITMAPTENCDVLMTFPDTTDDHTLLWLLNQIRLGIPQVRIQIRQHKYTHTDAFFITSTFENLLRGAEQMGMQKAVKPRYGGGTRRFSCEEDDIYENIESELCFFTSQERQSIIKYWLDNLRAKHGEALHNIYFLEGQPLSRYFNIYFLLKCLSSLRIHVFSPQNLLKMLCVLGSTRAYSQGCDSSNVPSS